MAGLVRPNIQKKIADTSPEHPKENSRYTRAMSFWVLHNYYETGQRIPFYMLFFLFILPPKSFISDEKVNITDFYQI